MKESILDSNTRREFITGAVRDCAEGKGRCDLLPLGVVYALTNERTFMFIDLYITTGKVNHLYSIISDFSTHFGDLPSTLLEVSKHFEAGANKYAERNWEKGIPLHCYIDSAVRHYLKWLRGDTDERHDRAFVWNILCAIWTHLNKPEMIDLPFKESKDE
jgi:hypothetical protein